MEGRHFAIGDDEPVKEGDLALSVALKLKSELEKRSDRISFEGTKSTGYSKASPRF